MRRIAFAEALLRLLTSRSEARSIAGDLAEHARVRGRSAFWRDLTGIAGALLAAGLCAAPLRSLCRLLAGLALWLGFYVGLRTAAAYGGLLPLDARLVDGGPGSMPMLLCAGAALALSNLLAGACLGLDARRAGVHACVPLATFWVVTALALIATDAWHATTTWYCTLVYVLGIPLLYVAPLIGGGLVTSRLRATRLRAA
jgi:hypothetical protein